MWAQLIKTRLKDGHDDALTALMEQFQTAEAPGSGLIRSIAMRDQDDPKAVYMLVVFESEEHARARESDPGREERLTGARAMMAEIFDSPPEFVDLLVDAEYAPS